MLKTNNNFHVLDKKTLIIFFITILLFIFLFQFRSFQAFLTKYENILIDFRYRVSQINDQTDKIIIVDIDASSINKLSLWPWPRSFWGDAITNINKHGASVIGVDVLFDAKSLDNNEDILFSEALKNYNNVVLASRKYIEKKDHYELELWSNPISIFANHSHYGFVNFPFDQDGIIRKSYTTLKSNQTQSPISFDFLITSLYTSQYPNITYPSHVEKSKLFYINFSKSNGFSRIPFFLVLEDRVPNPEIFKDKIVLIGASDPSLNDLYFTPLGLIPGIDIHAHTILTCLEDLHIKELNPIIIYLLLFFLSFLTIYIVLRVNGLISFLSVSSILAIYSLIVMIMFTQTFTIMPWAIFIIIILFSFLGSIIFKLIFEEKEKTYIRNIFSQYVSPEVVNKLIMSPTALRLGGEKKEITIFFSDIRSFTSLSENNPPELIVSQLNEYLDAMTLCIFKWKGTLDKYVGDEIMAIWGAPLDQDNHAKLAVQCAWEQLSILKTLQQKWEKEEKPKFDIGMGINTGHVIVGNIGSSMHKDFTVIGDDVNYAARLEAITRDFSVDNHVCRFIISDATYKLVSDICTVKPLGEISIKGKEKTYPIYEVIDVTLTEPS